MADIFAHRIGHDGHDIETNLAGQIPFPHIQIGSGDHTPLFFLVDGLLRSGQPVAGARFDLHKNNQAARRSNDIDLYSTYPFAARQNRISFALQIENCQILTTQAQSVRLGDLFLFATAHRTKKFFIPATDRRAAR